MDHPVLKGREWQGAAPSDRRVVVGWPCGTPKALFSSHRRSPALPAGVATGIIPGSMAASITELLQASAGGDEEAKAELFVRLYDDLYARASNLMFHQRADHTLQPTALVHEAYLRLARSKGALWSDRTHFLALAANTMRCVLVDHARGKNRQKRGGEANAVPLGSLTLAFNDRAIDLLALDDALVRLEQRDPRAARVVELRFFGGLSVAETAAVLDAAVRSVERDWELARAWLYRELSK